MVFKQITVFIFVEALKKRGRGRREEGGQGAEEEGKGLYTYHT